MTGSSSFPIQDGFGQFHCQQILPSVQLKTVSDWDWSGKALECLFVPCSAPSPRVLRACSKMSVFFKSFTLRPFPRLSRWPSPGHGKCSESVCCLSISSSTKQSPRKTQVLSSIPPISYVCLPAPTSEEGARASYKDDLSVWALNPKDNPV